MNFSPYAFGGAESFEGIESSSDVFAGLAGIVAIYGVILLFASLVGIVMFILKGIGLYKMNKNLGLTNGWMAFVPLLSEYALGKIAAQYIKKDGRKSAPFGGWLLGLNIGMSVLSMGFLVYVIINALGFAGGESTEAVIIPFVIKVLGGAFLILAGSIAYSVIYYISLWRIYAIFDSSTATVFLVVSMLFNIAAPIILFIIRNNKPNVTYFDRIGYIPPAPQPQAEAEAVNE